MRAIFFALILLLALSAPAFTVYKVANFSFGQLVPWSIFSYVPPPPDNSVFFTGDIMLARHVEYLMSKHGADYPFSNLSLGQEGDYIVGNFEGVIPEKHEPTKVNSLRFSVPESSVSALTNFGITHLSLANNHSYDFGSAGYNHTKNILQTASITPMGDQKENATSSLSFVEVDGESVALVSLVSVGRNIDDVSLEEIFVAAEASSSAQIVYIHWGSEYEKTHNDAQFELAEKLVALGADLIVGHHPHVIQDAEIISGVPVFYSLGNFIFDQYFDDSVQTGLVLEVIEVLPSVKVDIHPVTSLAYESAPTLLDPFTKEKMLAELFDPTLLLLVLAEPAIKLSK